MATINNIDEKTILSVKNKRVSISYKTKGLGDGSDAEQEEDTITGVFDGDFDNRGRTTRFRFNCESDKRPYYLFVDEILELTVE